MSSFAKPENALQRANELVAVGQSATALQTLHDVIVSKRHRSWQQTMEDIMLRYVELCVELQKGKTAKDGLIQYRMNCQHVNIASLETVISHLLEKAENALVVAKEEAGVEHLPDDEVTPENLIAALAAGEQAQDADKTQVERVLPWMKFLWESYRTVLEILRNNAKLEAVYQATAQRALKYCHKYGRNSEFKRLCDILRSHLANINKHSGNQQTSVSLNSGETVHFMIETRFVQLDVACQMELWQEAFRSIEDIHSLMQINRKPLKPNMIHQYFDKLAVIFWASENHLLHAHALAKLYDKASQLSQPSQEELSAMASKLLVAALCVPQHENRKA
jgi:translation initiation factor 3 subunit A